MADPTLKEILEAITATRSDVARLDSRLTRVESNMATKSEVAKLESKMESRFDRVDTRLDKVESGLQRVESRVDDLDRDINKHISQAPSSSNCGASVTSR